MKQIVIGKTVLLLGTLWLAGCEETNRYKQVAEIAQKSAERQAQQNTEMAQFNREVAVGTRRMVEADAVARKEIIEVHQQIQSERLSLNDGFDALEAERKQIARERRTESVIVPAAKVIGVVVVAATVIVFCWSLLFGLVRNSSSDAELNDVLIHELVCDHPRLLRGPDTSPATVEQRLDDNSQRRLLSAGDDSADEVTN